MTPPAGYTRAQILLHWLTALLLAAQFLLHDPIKAAWAAHLEGRPAAFDPVVSLHVVVGVSLFAFALWRIAIRLRRGAPAPAGQNPVKRRVAVFTHGALYALMLAMPVSGAAAWFGGIEVAATAHNVMKVALLALVAFHVAGTLVGQFVLGANPLARMRKPLA